MASKDNLIDLDQLREEVKSHQDKTYDWTFENGRRYASSEMGHYFIPNDEPEIHRLNTQHWLFTELKGGKLLLAPLAKKDGLKILDVGCGTGIWCLQMAEDYPSATIVGLDVSPIQPKNKPAGVEWLLLDFENQTWPFPEEHFDLIHLSLVHGSVVDWDTTMAKLVKYLAPGGFIEHQELSMGEQYYLDESDKRVEMTEMVDPIQWYRWVSLMNEASDKRGRTLHLGPKLKGFQEKSGLVNVHEAVYPLPVGTWPSDPKQKSLGGQMLVNVLDGMEGFTMALFTKVLGWSAEDTKDFMQDCKRDLQDNNIKKMVDTYVVYGQKAGGPLGNAEKGGASSDRLSTLWKDPQVQLGTGMVLAAAVTAVVATVIMRRL